MVFMLWKPLQGMGEISTFHKCVSVYGIQHEYFGGGGLVLV